MRRCYRPAPRRHVVARAAAATHFPAASVRLILALLAALILFAAVRARAAEPILPAQTFEGGTLDATPEGWQGPGGPTGWVVKETTDAIRPGRAIASAAVGASPSSFLTQGFAASKAPYVLSFYARAQSDTALRGLSWGLSEGAPTAQTARAFHLALGPGGKLTRFDGAAWQGMAPIQAGQWHHVVMTVFPIAGEFEVRLDGASLTPEPLPFWNAVDPDTLFLNNFAAGPEGAEILAAGFEITPSPIPSAPAGVRVTRLAPDAVDLDWLAPEVPVAGYRVFRNGEAIKDLPGNATRFYDSGLKPSTLHIYKLAALGEGERPWQSRLSRPAADWTLPPAGTNAPRGDDYDVLVVGATPGGIAAALAAARLGATVALTEPSQWVGGMMAGGLSNTDFRFKETHGGFFREFTRQVLDYYQRVYGPDSRQVQVSIGGYKFEPRVARAVLIRMLAGEPRISLYKQTRATGVTMDGKRVTGATFEDLAGGPARSLTGKVVIDATYEGDIAAFAGAKFRVGRESREEFNEQHAGELFWNVDTKKIEWDKGSGKGDHRVQAYNYRLTMTGRADNRVLSEKPEGYDRTHYLKIVGDVKSGYANLKRVLGYQGLLPNDKWDINNSGAYWPSTDFVGANYDYPTADWKRREEIIRAHRAYIQGLLHFLQNDPELPEEFREQARRFGLARDEFVDNDNWPTQIYVREGRRIFGEYWFTENDTRPREGEQRSPLQPEGVGVGDYSLDSHATQVPKPETPHLVEGFFYGGKTEPYQIPFGVMIPKGIEGLLTPVAVSATHIGLSTVRMEPTWMAMGQAAGTGAYISLRTGVPIRRLPIALVQDVTLLTHQVTVFLRDVGYEHRDFGGLNYAALIGLFSGYQAEPEKPVDRATAAGWLWQWMRHRWPELKAPKEMPQFADVAADAPQATAIGVMGAIEAMGKVPSGAEFRPAQPLSADDAARWIARAHRVSDRWHRGSSYAFRTELEGRIAELLKGVAAQDSGVKPEALTRGQFLRLMYLAAQTATPR